MLAPAPAMAITGGGVDSSHPFVVGVITAAGTRPTCTGVWTDIGSARRVVVTDAHCVSATRGARVGVFFGQRWTADAHTFSGRSYRHPGYDAHTHHDDVAVLVLSIDPHVTPASLAAVGSATRTTKVVVVGYGWPHSGERRVATERTTSWSSWRLYLQPGTGNACDGDSGGPDLRPGTRQVVALTDDGTCARDEDTRLDVGSVRAFVLGRH